MQFGHREPTQHVKLKYTKKSDCLVGIVGKRKLYDVSHGYINVRGIFWKISIVVEKTY